MTNTIKRLGIVAGLAGAIAIVLSLSGCKRGNPSPERFRTITSHFEGARFFANAYHQGVRRIGDDLDFDRDNMNDLYMLANDGNLYTTCSRRLIQGEDTACERTWDKQDPEMLKNAKKGKYESPQCY